MTRDTRERMRRRSMQRAARQGRIEGLTTPPNLRLYPKAA